MPTSRNSQAQQLYEQALVSMSVEDFRAALATLLQVLTLEPKWEQCWEQLAAAIQFLGDGVEAEKALARAQGLEIKSNRFWYSLAQSLQGHLAQEAYRLALQADPGDEQSLLELAWNFRTSGDKESASKLYSYLLQVYKDRKDWRALNSLGDTLRRLVGNLDLAEESLRKALEIKPDYFDAWKNMCYLMCSRRDPAAAQQTARRFLQSYPDHPRIADAWVCLSNVLRSFNDITGAEEAVRQALAADPECQGAWSKLADIRFERGDMAEGQHALEKANLLDYNKRFDNNND